MVGFPCRNETLRQETAMRSVKAVAVWSSSESNEQVPDVRWGLLGKDSSWPSSQFSLFGGEEAAGSTMRDFSGWRGTSRIGSGWWQRKGANR